MIVRAVTVNLDVPPEWQRKAGYAMSEDRRHAPRLAVGQRIKDCALEQLLAELCERPHVDAMVHRDLGHPRPPRGDDGGGRRAAGVALPARQPAARGERDVYIDALLDDALATRDAPAAAIVGPDARPRRARPRPRHSDVGGVSAAA